MNPLTVRLLGALLRTALAASGGAAYLSDNELEQLLGAIGVIVALGWSVYQKVQAQRAEV